MFINDQPNNRTIDSETGEYLTRAILSLRDLIYLFSLHSRNGIVWFQVRRVAELERGRDVDVTYTVLFTRYRPSPEVPSVLFSGGKEWIDRFAEFLPAYGQNHDGGVRYDFHPRVVDERETTYPILQEKP